MIDLESDQNLVKNILGPMKLASGQTFHISQEYWTKSLMPLDQNSAIFCPCDIKEDGYHSLI
jgi:hypothetical protein